MSVMRPIAILLLVGAAALAQDRFADTLKRFQKAAAGVAEPQEQAKVYPAIEELVATGDARAVEPLLGFLVATYRTEAGLFETIAKLRGRTNDLNQRVATLDKELEFLRLKEKAGDRSVGPEIQRRDAERQEKMRLAAQARMDTIDVGRTVDFVREVRDRLAEGCARLLKGLEGEQRTVGLNGARRALDIQDREQALFLVRVLRTCGLKEAEPHLLEVFAHPKVDDAVLRAAQYALAPVMTRRGADVLLSIWERDPEGRGKHARHALSLAAHQNLADLAAARAWAKTLSG